MSAVGDEFNERRNGSVLLYRVNELAKTVNALLKWRGEVDVERERLRGDAKSLAAEMEDLKKSVDGLRRVILGFSFTIAGSAVVFALTVLAGTGVI